ncbi:hypothetical protein RCL1_007860 [Eukaryota sp. TZLM3-RCL]
MSISYEKLYVDSLYQALSSPDVQFSKQAFLRAIRSNDICFFLNLTFSLCTYILFRYETQVPPNTTQVDLINALLLLSNYPRTISFVHSQTVDEVLLAFGWLVHFSDILHSNPDQRRHYNIVNKLNKMSFVQQLPDKSPQLFTSLFNNCVNSLNSCSFLISSFNKKHEKVFNSLKNELKVPVCHYFDLISDCNLIVASEEVQLFWKTQSQIAKRVDVVNFNLTGFMIDCNQEVEVDRLVAQLNALNQQADDVISDSDSQEVDPFISSLVDDFESDFGNLIEKASSLDPCCGLASINDIDCSRIIDSVYENIDELGIKVI